MNEPWNTYNGEPPMSLLEGGTNEMPMIDNQPPMSLMPTSEQSMPQSPIAQIMLQNIAKKAIAQLQMQQARQKMEQEVASMPSGADERTRQTIANMRAMKESGLFDSPYRKHPIMMGIGSVLAGIGQGMTGQPYLDSALNRMDEQAKNIGTLAQSGMMTPAQEMALMFRQQSQLENQDFKQKQFDALEEQRKFMRTMAEKGLDIRNENLDIRKQQTMMANPEQLATMGKALIDGTLVPSQIGSRNGKLQAIAAAKAIDPTYDAARADMNFYVQRMERGAYEKFSNNVIQFEKTFRKNADLALQLSDNFDRTKIPLVNKAIMAGKLNITGDPEASRLAVAIWTVASEYARLVSSPGATGTMLTDTARAEAENLLNVWQNEGTVRGLLDPQTGIMSLDAKNRLDAISETREMINKKYNKSTSKEAGGVSIDALFEGLK